MHKISNGQLLYQYHVQKLEYLMLIELFHIYEWLIKKIVENRKFLRTNEVVPSRNRIFSIFIIFTFDQKPIFMSYDPSSYKEFRGLLALPIVFIG